MKRALEYDIAIIGTGPVACALVTALSRRSLTRSLRIALIGPQRIQTPIDEKDPRTLALSYGSRILLDTAWPTQAIPIHQIHISQQGHFGSTLIDRDECALPALGYVLRYSALLHTLSQAAQAHLHNLEQYHGVSSPGWLTMEAGIPIQDEQGVTLPLNPHTSPKENTSLQNSASNSSTFPTFLRTRLLIYAEGHAPAAHSTCTASHFASGRQIHDYQQTALIGIVRASTPKPYTAWERFTAEGPLALLPLGGPGDADYALVWCSAPSSAHRRFHASENTLLAELGQAFGGRIGDFVGITDRACFPLTLQQQPMMKGGRITAIGNAAQTLHPVAGQGLNLGLRDAWVLAQSLSQGATPEALTLFAKQRQADRKNTICTTHTLARAFISSNFSKLSLLPTFYSACLTLLDTLSPLKTHFAHQMIFGKRSA